MAELDVIRRGAVALAEYACARPGAPRRERGKLDPVYVAVTEGRDRRSNWKHYSSCGDLPHWMLWCLGCHAPWINRSAAPNGWRVGQNISLLAARGALPGDAWEPEPGDVFLIWNSPTGTDAHACVWLGGGDVANYGAGGMCDTEFPGANITRPTLTHDGRGWVLGKRKVQRHISLARVPFSAPAELPDGLELTGEDYDALRGGP